MTNHVNGDTPQNIRVWALAKGTYAAPFTNFRTLVAIFWLPVVLLLVGLIVPLMNFPGVLFDSKPSGSVVYWGLAALEMVVRLTFGLATMIILIASTISYHRFIILDEVPPKFGVRLGLRELKYFGYTLLLSLLFLLFVLAYVAFSAGVGQAHNRLLDGVGGSVGPLLIIALIGVMVFFSLRLSLILPFVATDQHPGIVARLKASWNNVRGHTLRLFGALVLILIPITILAGLFISLMVTYMAGAFQPNFQLETFLTGMAVFMVFGLVFNFLHFILPVSFISLACRNIMMINANTFEDS